jgi:hypothetical protein
MERLRERGISKDEVITALQRGVCRPDGFKRDPTYTYTLGALIISIAVCSDGRADLMSAMRRERWMSRR